MSSQIDGTLEPDFAALLADWQGISADEHALLPRWEAALGSMSAQVHGLKLEGKWLNGGYTLMHALGLHHNEVYLCRALAWVLTPEAGHGLGASVLGAVLERCGVAASGAESATVVTEEARGDTRADIVVRFGGSSLLIEAKVFAGEQERQCARLADLWGDDLPTLVFLTRDGSRPRSAGTSIDDWHRIRWREIGQIISAAAQKKGCSPGVHEFAHTIEAYGG